MVCIYNTFLKIYAIHKIQIMTEFLTSLSLSTIYINMHKIQLSVMCTLVIKQISSMRWNGMKSQNNSRTFPGKIFNFIKEKFSKIFKDFKMTLSF